MDKVKCPKSTLKKSFWKVKRGKIRNDQGCEDKGEIYKEISARSSG